MHLWYVNCISIKLLGVFFLKEPNGNYRTENTISELKKKNSLSGLKSRMDMTNNSISEPEEKK